MLTCKSFTAAQDFVASYWGLLIQAGDKIHELSASFGEDVWSAGNFGQCMYAIKTRNGELYFKFKKNYGDLSCFDVSAIFLAVHHLYLSLTCNAIFMIQMVLSEHRLQYRSALPLLLMADDYKGQCSFQNRSRSSLPS